MSDDTLDSLINQSYELTVQGRMAEAVTALQRSIECAPATMHAALYQQIAGLLMQADRRAEALEYWQRAINVAPGRVELHLGKAFASLHLGNLAGAEQAFRDAIRADGGSADAYHGLAALLRQQGRLKQAIDLAKRAIECDKNLVKGYLILAAALLDYGEPDEALAAVQTALELDPEELESRALEAAVLQRMGRSEEAFKKLKSLLDRDTGQYHLGVAITFARVAARLQRYEEAIGLLEMLLGDRINWPNNRTIHFMLGSLYDAMQKYDDAFDHYRQGNALKGVQADIEEGRAEATALITVFQPGTVASLPCSQVDSCLPVFVIGAPRSGTTLIEQVLAAHPQVYGAGELPDISQLAKHTETLAGGSASYPDSLRTLSPDALAQMARAYLQRLQQMDPQAKRVVDKMPGNLMHAGFIRMLFPNARIIHIRRDPRDTCLSQFFQDFSVGHHYSFDLTSLGQVYCEYERIMQHWHKLGILMLEVRYEDLVENLEAQARRLVEYCGLEWDERCLQFHTQDRYVTTASYDQVSRELYTSSVGRWHHYECHLGPLLDALSCDRDLNKRESDASG